jgi:hypothetical protein
MIAATRFDYQPPLERSIRLSPVELGSEGTAFDAGFVGVSNFTRDDLETLELSLRDTLAQFEAGSVSVSGDPIDIHVLVRRHLVAADGGRKAAMACVAWSATADGRVLYEEQFFATASDFMLGKLWVPGAIKDDVNRRVVHRITQAIIYLAAGFAKRLPAVTEGTYDSFEAAADSVPSTMLQAPPPGLRYRSGVYPTVYVPWFRANPKDAVDQRCGGWKDCDAPK